MHRLFVSDSWKHRFEKVQDMTISEEVQVILYHTHNTETYLPTGWRQQIGRQKWRCGTGCRGVSGGAATKIWYPHGA